MGCLNFVQMVLFLMPVLINCQLNTLLKTCGRISCPSYKSNKTECKYTSHLADPFNNECVAKCDGPCIDGYCDVCICHSSNAKVFFLAPFLDCKRLYNNTYCSEDGCKHYPTTSCDNIYTHNPYTNYECVQRCDEDSCGKGGTCSPRTGHCDCHLGYRHDVTNPRICLKIPENNTTISIKTCHRGFKLNADGDCISACGDCKNGCCGTDGVCRCWENYELDVASLTCVLKHDEELNMNCSDKCSNGICNSGDVCQCPDCSDYIDKTVNCRTDGQNRTIYDVGGLGAYYDCGNTSLSENKISKATHKTRITILVCITVILLIATIVLIFIVLKMKRALPLNEGKVKILFGGNF